MSDCIQDGEAIFVTISATPEFEIVPQIGNSPFCPISLLTTIMQAVSNFTDVATTNAMNDNRWTSDNLPSNDMSQRHGGDPLVLTASKVAGQTNPHRF